MGKTFQFSKFLASAAALLLVAMCLFVAPNNTSAIDVTKSVDSTMTITMQQSSGNDPSGDGTTDDDATDDDSTTDDSTSNDGKSSTKYVKAPVTTSEKGGGLPLTGDVLLLTILGLVALFAGSAFCLVESKKLNVVQGAHVRKSSSGVHMRPQNPEDVKKRIMAVAITSVLLVTTCFGGLASKTNVLAEGVDASVKCTSAVTIDEAGNVISANVTVLNNSLKAIDVESIVAPAELDGWTATFTTTSVAVSGSATGTWDGKTVPSDILDQVKTSGSATLTFETTIEYDEEEATVTFDANAPSGTTATVDGTSATKTSTVVTGTALTADLIPADVTVTCSDATWQFAGWAENPAFLPSEASKNADLAAQAVALTGQKTYYAIWKDTATSEFWISSTNTTGTQVSDFTNDTNYRTGREVLNDVDILNAGSTNASYSIVFERWNGYYDNDVKLYATWSGSDATNNLDKLVEFRILQVGEHDGDESVVTFMATHSLPTAKAMNSESTNAGGWGSSAMLGEMTSYVQAGLPSGLASAAKEVSKVATSGNYTNGWVEGTTVASKFWLPSYSEIFGETSTLITSSGYFKAEGTQYAWCKSNVTNPTGSNSSLININKTRSGGNTPADAFVSFWWLRSPLVDSSNSFGIVRYDGSQDFDDARASRGVAPCFAF